MGVAKGMRACSWDSATDKYTLPLTDRVRPLAHLAMLTQIVL